MTVTTIIEAIITALKETFTGVGSSIVDFFQTCFTVTNGETTQLSVFAIVALCMIGFAVAMGFIRMILYKIG